MSFSESAANIMRGMFDNGIDEILIFAFIFVFILLSGRGKGSKTDGDVGILPLLIIGAFLLMFFNFGRQGNESRNIE